MRLHTGESSRQCPAVSKEISDTVVLLNNGHAVRCLLNIYIYTLVLLSALVREASFCSGQRSLQTPDWTSVATPTPRLREYCGSGGGGLKERKGQKMGRNVIRWSLLDLTQPLHPRAHGSCDCLHKTGLVNISYGRGIHDPPSLAE